jgi:hypothetical protein
VFGFCKLRAERVLVFTFLAQKIFCQLSLRKRADAACSPLFFPQRNLGWACLLYLHRSPLYICMVVPTLCYTSSLPLQFQKRPRRSMPPCMHLVQQTHREESSTAFSIDRSIRVPLLFSFFFHVKLKLSHWQTGQMLSHYSHSPPVQTSPSKCHCQ